MLTLFITNKTKKIDSTNANSGRVMAKMASIRALIHSRLEVTGVAAPPVAELVARRVMPVSPLTVPAMPPPATNAKLHCNSVGRSAAKAPVR